MRWLVGVPTRTPLRCLVVVLGDPLFRYKIDESSEQGSEGMCHFDDEGTEWIRGWDAEARGALLAGHALKEEPSMFGAQGPQGATGVQGRTGPTGVQGAHGPTGPQGLTGALGAQGPQGMAGWPAKR